MANPVAEAVKVVLETTLFLLRIVIMLVLDFTTFGIGFVSCLPPWRLHGFFSIKPPALDPRVDHYLNFDDSVREWGCTQLFLLLHSSFAYAALALNILTPLRWYPVALVYGKFFTWCPSDDKEKEFNDALISLAPGALGHLLITPFVLASLVMPTRWYMTLPRLYLVLTAPWVQDTTDYATYQHLYRSGEWRNRTNAFVINCFFQCLGGLFDLMTWSIGLTMILVSPWRLCSNIRRLKRLWTKEPTGPKWGQGSNGRATLARFHVNADWYCCVPCISYDPIDDPDADRHLFTSLDSLFNVFCTVTDVLCAPFLLAALLSPIRSKLYLRTLAYQYDRPVKWASACLNDSEGSATKNTKNTNTINGDGDGAEASKLSTTSSPAATAAQADAQKVEDFEEGPCHGYHLAARCTTFWMGTLAIGDLLVAPILVPLILTRYRWIPIKSKLQSAGAWGPEEYGLVSHQFLCLVLDALLLPLMLILLVTQARWAPVYLAIKTKDNMMTLGGPMHKKILQQAGLLVLDLVSLPFLLVLLVTVYRSGPALHALKHRHIWHKKVVYYHLAVFGNILVLIHDLVLLPFAVIALLSVYRTGEVYSALAEVMGKLPDPMSWRGRRRGAGAGGESASAEQAEAEATVVRTEPTTGSGQNQAPGQATTHLVVEVEAAGDREVVEGEAAGGTVAPEHVGLVPIWPTNYIRGDLWFTALALPVDLPFFVFGLIVILTGWRTSKLIGDLKKARARWQEFQHLGYYPDGPWGDMTTCCAEACCCFCCWFELLCCCCTWYDNGFNRERTMCGGWRDPWGWGTRCAAEWDARFCALMQFMALVRDILVLPLGVLGLFKLPTLIGRILSIMSNPIQEEPVCKVKRATIRMPEKGAPALTLDLADNPDNESSPPFALTDAKIHVIGSGFWQTVREEMPGGGAIAALAIGMLPLKLQDRQAPRQGTDDYTSVFTFDLASLRDLYTLGRSPLPPKAIEDLPLDSGAVTTTVHFGVKLKRSSLVKRLRTLNQAESMLLQVEATDEATNKRVAVWGLTLKVRDILTAFSAGDSVPADLDVTDAVSSASRTAMFEAEREVGGGNGLVDGLWLVLIITAFEVLSDWAVVCIDLMYLCLTLLLVAFAPWRGGAAVVGLMENPAKWPARVAEACADFMKFADSAVSEHFDALPKVLSMLMKDVMTEQGGFDQSGAALIPPVNLNEALNLSTKKTHEFFCGLYEDVLLDVDPHSSTVYSGTRWGRPYYRSAQAMRQRRKVLLELERGGSAINEYKMLVEGCLKSLEGCDGTDALFDQIVKYTQLVEKRAACWALRLALIFEQVGRELDVYPAELDPKLALENDKYLAVVGNKEADLERYIKQARERIDLIPKNMWGAATTHKRKSNRKWGVWLKRRSLARGIVKIFAWQAVLDYGIILLSILLILNPPRIIPFCRDLRKGGSCSPTHYSTRRTVMKHFHIMNHEMFCFARLGVSVLLCLLMFWAIPEFLSGLALVVTSVDDATIYCVDHMRYATSSLWDVICVLPFMWRTYKMLVSSAVYAVLVPATTVATLLCYGPGPSTARAPPRPPPIETESDLGAVEHGDGRGGGGGGLPPPQQPHVPSKAKLGLAGLLYAPALIALTWLGATGHDTLAISTIAAAGLGAILFFNSLLRCLDLALPLDQRHPTPANTRTTVMSRLSWSTLTGLLVAPCESGTLCCLALWIAGGRGDDDSWITRTAGRVIGFNSQDGHVTRACVIAAVVLAVVACVVLSLPHATDPDDPKEREVRISILSSPLYTTFYALSGQLFLAWIVATLLRAGSFDDQTAVEKATVPVLFVFSLLLAAPEPPPLIGGGNGGGGGSRHYHAATLTVTSAIGDDPGHVFFDTTYSAVLALIHTLAAATAVLAPAHEGVSDDTALIAIGVLAALAVAWGLVFPALGTKACSLELVPILRAGGSLAALWTCIVASAVQSFSSPSSSSLLLFGYLVIALLTIGAGAFHQRRRSLPWHKQRHTAEALSACRDVVAVSRAAGVEVEATELGTDQLNRSPEDLAVWLMSIEQQILAERLAPQFLLDRQRWRALILQGSITSFAAVRDSAIALHGAIRPLQPVSALTRSYLTRLLRSKLNRYEVAHVWAFMADANAINDKVSAAINDMVKDRFDGREPHEIKTSSLLRSAHHACRRTGGDYSLEKMIQAQIDATAHKNGARGGLSLPPLPPIPPFPLVDSAHL